MQENDIPNQSRKWQFLVFLTVIATLVLVNLKEAAVFTAAPHIKEIMMESLISVPDSGSPSLPAIHQPQSTIKNGGPLKLIIAKTLAAKDIAETLLDIQSFVERYSSASSSSSQYQIEWRLFCYKNETFAGLLERYSEDQWLENYNTKIYLELGANKVNFWHKYLNPQTSIDQDVDFVWMMDGDIQIRYMAWECFWGIVGRFQPSIFAPSLMTNMHSADWERRKVYVGTTHPHKCHVSGGTKKKKKKKNKSKKKAEITPLTPRPVNDFQRIIAMDVWVIEIQLPVFSRIAWETAYTIFEEKVQGWGKFKSSWAPDLFWCKIIDKELHGTNHTERDRLQGRPMVRWPKVKKTCDLDPKIMHDVTGVEDLRYYHDEVSGKQMSHPCMIIHSTPVRDLDSRTIKLHKNRQSNKAFLIKGDKDLQKYEAGLPEMKTRKKLGQYQLYRAYTSTNETEYKCQACRHTACLGD